MEGESYGVEVALGCHALPWWRLQASYTYLQIHLHPDNDSTDVWSEGAEGQSPHNQFSLRSLMELPWNLQLDVWTRYVDNLPDFDVENYLTLDARVGCHLRENLEISIVGQHLFDNRHPEFGAPFFFSSIPTEVERSVFGRITWRF
jgi:iron complex outermembrane receptor protein